MTRIKICGITNCDDARLADELGADAIGVIGVPESPRYVSPKRAEEIRAVLRPFTKLVVVARTVADAIVYSPDVIQYYEKGPEFNCGAKLICVVRIGTESDLSLIAAICPGPSGLLLDSLTKNELGGSGKSFDWSLAKKANRLTDLPIILAGGLTPENVQQAVELVLPYAVDVSTGVEEHVGKKSPRLLEKFIAGVRAADVAIAQ